MRKLVYRLGHQAEHQQHCSIREQYPNHGPLRTVYFESVLFEDSHLTAGGFSLTADNVDSSFRSQLSATQPIMHDPFIAQPALPDFHQGFHAQASRSGLPPVQTPTLLQVCPSNLHVQSAVSCDAKHKRQAAAPMHPAFSVHCSQMMTQTVTFLQAEFQMDPAKQAQALCHNGLSITALQQQLQDLKGKSSLDASCLRGSQAGPDTFLQDAGSARHVSTNLQGADAVIPWSAAAAARLQSPCAGL